MNPIEEDEDRPFKQHENYSSPPLKWTPCSIGRFCSLLMTPLVLGLIALTYVPYIHFFTNASLYSTLCLIIFHILLFLTLLSYFQVVTTDPGTTTADWLSTIQKNPYPPYKKCRKTQQYKPLRSHYCSVTGRVVLNHDHFCPWVANSVGFFNRKFFVLFCFWAMITCLFGACTLGPIAFSTREIQVDSSAVFYKALALMSFIMNVTFALALSLFCIGHFYMAAKNQTSLEGSKESQRYDRGWRENFKSVFGKDSRYWFIPIYASGLEGDGIHWRLQNGSWDGQADKFEEIKNGENNML